MKKREKKDKKKLIIGNRRGVMLIALLAVLILVINLITASYSWFTPEDDTQRGMKYGFEGKIRSENCLMNTYTGIKLDGSDAIHTPASGEYVNQIRYNSSPATGSQTIVSGETAYFKTEILNQDTDNASDISLYISTLNGSGFTVAVTYPANTVRKFTANQSNMYIVRDAYVKRKDVADVNGPGKLEIEWFVTNTSSSAITVNLNYLYLLYN